MYICMFNLNSVRYHSLHPNYIHDRLKSLGKQYQLRVLLVLVDTVSSVVYVYGIAHIGITNTVTLINTTFSCEFCLSFKNQSESQKVLHGLAKMALLADLTLIVSWRSV